MHWAADRGGSPAADVCEGNPGEVFPGRGDVRVLLVFRVCHYHGPAGEGMRRFDYRTRTAVDRSERKPGRRNAGNDGGSTGGQPLPGVALTGAAVAVGTWEKREVKGVSRLAPVVTLLANNGLDVDGAQVNPARSPAMAFLRVPALFLTGLEKPLAQPAGGKP